MCVPQISNWSGTFFAVSYSKPALSNQNSIQVLIKWSTKSQEQSNGGGQL